MALAPYREQGEGLVLSVDEAFGATVDGSADELWRRLRDHPLVRASDRRSPYPPPPGGAPLLATRDGDTITVRYWRRRMSPETLRLELRVSATAAAGRTRVEGRIRSRAAGIPRWHHRDERIEDVATLVAYGVAALVAGGLVAMVLGGGLMIILAAPVAVAAQILGSLAFNRLADATTAQRPPKKRLPTGTTVRAVRAVTEPKALAPIDSTRLSSPDDALGNPARLFERLLVDLGVVDPTS